MSGPVFVVDELGTPLMPLAAAYARRLLSSTKAQLRAHPTLTIIQLNRVVPQPILRPIIVGIQLHSATAELFVLATGPRTIFSLLYVVVDLGTHRLWQPRQPIQRQMRRQLLNIRATIGTLWLFLPISHIVIVGADVRNTATPDIAQRLQHYLKSDELHVTIAERDGPVPGGVSPDLFHQLVQFATQPTLPALVAVPIEPPDQAARLRQIQNAASGIFAPGIGVVGNPPIHGIVQDRVGDDAIELHVPVAVDPTRVVWERVIVQPPTTIQSWPAGSVALLRVNTVIAQPGITRWDDYFYDRGTSQSS